MRVTTTVNGERHEADDVWEGESLLYVLRERLGLPGSKNACEQGECGSCTVYLDGVPVCACLVAAGQAEGREVGTVEGLADGDDAAPGAAGVRRRRRGAVRLLHARAARRRPTTCWPATRDPDDPEIREALAGNLCRCTGYEKILDAVRLAAGRGRDDAMTTRHRRLRGRHDGRRPARSTPSGTSWSRATGSPRSAPGRRPRDLAGRDRYVDGTGCLVTPGPGQHPPPPLPVG